MNKDETYYENPTTNQEIDQLYRIVCTRFQYIMILLLSSFTILYNIEDIQPLNIIISFATVFHILLLPISYKISGNDLNSTVFIYLIYASFLLFLNATYYNSLNQSIALLWFVLIPIGGFIFFSKKKIILLSITVVISMLASIILAEILPDHFFIPLLDSQYDLITNLTIIFFILILLFLIYYLIQLQTIRSKQLERIISHQKQTKTQFQPTTDETMTTSSSHRESGLLYMKISEFVKEHKAYCDPEYTIIDLAKDMNSNVKYVSKAINTIDKQNFNSFLNKYRIEMVKELFDKNYHNKYTIRYIYTMVGFRNQTTFNKAFKAIEGVTPSEYIKVQVNEIEEVI